MPMRQTNVRLSIQETALRERVFETLKRFGYTDEVSTELSFAITKDVRKSAGMTCTLEEVPDISPPKGGPYR